MQKFQILLLLPFLARPQLAASWIIPRNTTNSTLPIQANQTTSVPLTNQTAPTAETNQTSASSIASSMQNITSTLSNAQNAAVRANLQALNPKNATCDVVSQTADQQWDFVGGDEVLTTALSMYNNNALICVECFGLTKDECGSTSKNCRNGVKDASNGPRLDTGMAVLSNDTANSDLHCDIGSGGCDSAPACTAVLTPGMWAVRKSLTTLHNTLTTVYTAINNAQGNATNSIGTFQDVFAPPPSDSGELFGAIMQTVISLMFGLAGPILEGAEAGAEALATSIDVASTLTEFGRGIAEDVSSSGSTSSDPSVWLSNFASNIRTAVASASTSLFTTGQSSSNGGLSLSDAVKNGALMKADTTVAASLDELSKRFVRLLFQQLAVFTWDNLQKDGKKHYPFIAFDAQPCDQVDQKKSQLGAYGLDSHVSYGGNCYYLLDATALVEPGVFQPNGASTVGGIDCKTGALPGGTNKALEGQNVFGGLDLGDFVVPSVNSWLNNNKQNGAPAASYAANIIPKNLTDAGAVTLPVCDYSGDSGTAGKGCPDFAGKINRVTDGCVITS